LEGDGRDRIPFRKFLDPPLQLD